MRSNHLQASEQLDPEFLREPIGKPMLKAVLFHGLIVGAILGYGLLSNLFPHNTWGGNSEGAIAVQLVSNALPLPADRKPNDNVLATEKPSEAPAPPAPKAQPTVDEKAIPIASKMQAPKKPAEKKQEASKVQAPPQPTVSKVPQRQPTPPKPDNRAQYGEQASNSMPRSAMPGTTTVGATSVTASPGSRGFNYPWYIQNIQRKMQQNLYRGEVDPRTPAGSRTYITWVIRRDGTGVDAKLDRSSGSPTLDRACLRAEQRVDTFGPLPSPPSDPPPNVSYYCEY